MVIKNSKVIDCVVKTQFKHLKIGDIIKVPLGYAQYLLRNNIVLTATKKNDIESILQRKVFSQMQEEMDKLSSISSLTIERKTNRRDSSLFQKITAENVMSLICKKNSIKYFTCFKAVVDNIEDNNKQEINKCGSYNYSIYCKEQKLSTIRVIVISTTVNN